MTATDRSILRFIRQMVMIALAAVQPFVVWYIWSDPFKVVHRYDVYFENPEENEARIGLNKGTVTVRTYLNNLQSGYTKLPYNAFIFGSSISCYYDADQWRRMVGGSDSICIGIRPFHFDSSSESPMSMARKVRFLRSQEAPVDYALLVLDPIILGAEDNDDSPFLIDPVEIHRDLRHFLKYHYVFFRASTNADFLKSLIAAKITGKAINIGHNPIFEEQPIAYDRYYNQESIPQWDALIGADPSAFYTDHPLHTPMPAVSYSPSVINAEKAAAFGEIAEIFAELKTDYQVIVSPNRRGVALSDSDFRTLQNVFGYDRVHDFSTTYADSLKADTLLYDNTHYRPAFASMLMQAVYGAE